MLGNGASHSIPGDSFYHSSHSHFFLVVSSFVSSRSSRLFSHIDGTTGLSYTAASVSLPAHMHGSDLGGKEQQLGKPAGNPEEQRRLETLISS